MFTWTSAPLHVFAQSSMPSCPPEHNAFWNDCVGSDVYPNGETYVGDWKNNKKEGWGTSVYSSRQKYVGGWKSDLRDGHGIYYEDGKEIFDGEWFEGCPIISSNFFLNPWIKYQPLDIAFCSQALPKTVKFELSVKSDEQWWSIVRQNIVGLLPFGLSLPSIFIFALIALYKTHSCSGKGTNFGGWWRIGVSLSVAWSLLTNWVLFYWWNFEADGLVPVFKVMYIPIALLWVCSFVIKWISDGFRGK